ncbi:MAG: serine/threonine protein kinase [archaeon]|nr:MAG: serine/threonine protein kinase [archaeon]
MKVESTSSSPTHSERATLAQLTSTPYIRVLTYPRISLSHAKRRVKQLEKLGVEELVFQGKTKIGRLGLLGIGTVGVVVRAKTERGVEALKVRRLDANRPNMDGEVRVARMANRLGIGPEVRAHSKDFILMKLLEHQEVEDWVRGLKGTGTRDAVREMLHALLNQCRKLDIMGIDHGQLSNLRKHAVMAEGLPWIIDFESAGTARRPRNVTTAAQYLLIGGKVSPLVRRVLGVRDTSGILEALSAYKSEGSDYSYSKLLEELKIQAA